MNAIDGNANPAWWRRYINQYQWWWWPAGLLAALAATCFVVAVVRKSPPNEGFASAAAVLAIVGGLAVGIERTLELFWSFIDNTRWGGWWPLNTVRRRILQVEAKTKELLGAPAEALDSILEEAATTLKNANELSHDLASEIARYRGLAMERLPELKNRIESAEELMKPGSPRLQVVRAAKAEALEVYQFAYALAGRAGVALGETADTAKSAAATVEQLEDVIESFADNPARRVFSVLAGAMVGVIIAGAFGLNLFLAVAESDPSELQTAPGASDTPSPAGTGPTALRGAAGTVVPVGEVDDAADEDGTNGSPLEGDAGVILTGIVVGLGANPTHEVIKLLQWRKQRGTKTGESSLAHRPATAGSAAEESAAEPSSRGQLWALMGTAQRAGTPAPTSVQVPEPPRLIAGSRPRAIRRTE